MKEISRKKQEREVTSSFVCVFRYKLHVHWSSNCLTKKVVWKVSITPIYIYRKRFYSDQTVHGARRGRYTTVWISSTIDKIFIYNRVLTCPRSGCTGVNKIKKKRVHAQKVVDLSIGCLCGFQSRGDFRDRVVHLRVSLIP